MAGWENFFLAQVGASAALAGLVFVSVSISLPKILAQATLPRRAFQALAVLVQILITASLALVPGQPLMLLGIEILALGLAVWIMVAAFDLRLLRSASGEYRKRTALRMVLSELTAGLYVVAGIVLAIEGGQGFYWLVPAILLAFVVAMIDAWVLLVEINR